MLRALIPQGPKRALSWTVVLPAEWVKKFQLDKERKVEIEIAGDKLIISPERKVVQRVVELEGERYGKSFIRRALASLYRAGFEEIEIRFKEPWVLNAVHEYLDRISPYGFEITEETKSKCVLKKVAEEFVESFDDVLKRVFAVTLQMADSIYAELKRKKKINIKEMHELEKVLNKTSLYCQHTLIAHGYKEYKKTPMLYSLTRRLEHIGDRFTMLARLNPVPTEELVKQIAYVNLNLKKFYNLFLNFNVDSAKEISEHLYKEIRELRFFKRHEHKLNPIFIGILHDLLEVLFEAIADVVILNIEKLCK